jgi:hypothetical protein
VPVLARVVADTRHHLQGRYAERLQQATGQLHAELRVEHNARRGRSDHAAGLLHPRTIRTLDQILKSLQKCELTSAGLVCRYNYEHVTSKSAVLAISKLSPP